MDTYSVANIAMQEWVIKDKAMPSAVDVLGPNPTLIEVDGKVIIFKRENSSVSPK